MNLPLLYNSGNSWKEIPAMKPPPGVVANFTDPENCGSVVIILGAVFAPIMLLFVFIRIYTRGFIIRKLLWDDLTCVVAALLAIAYLIATIFGMIFQAPVFNQTGLISVTMLGDPLSNSYLIPTYFTLVLTPPTMIFTKITYFILYLGLFRPVKVLRGLIYLGIVVLVGFYTAIFVTQLVFMTPSRGQNFVTHNIYNLKTVERARQTVIPSGIFGIAIDLYIFILPMAAVSRLQLSKRRKIGICLVFATGSLACMADAMSLYFRILFMQNNRDITWNIIPIMAAQMAGTFIGVICACMPSIPSFFRHYNPLLKASASHLSTRFRSVYRIIYRPSTLNSNEDSKPGNMHGLKNQDVRNPKESKHSLPLRSMFGRNKTFHAYVGSGEVRTSSLEEDAIYITQDIQQDYHSNHSGEQEK